MRGFGVIACFVWVAACSTELTSQGQQVRQLSPETVQNCQFLGPVSGTELFGLDTTMDARSAQNKMRNAVGALGGNAFVLTQTSTSDDGTFVSGDAYKCP
ncbi:DUF4156 domain-containing protein [Ruegeria arenilitoris]|uniref:DUF4156 domain-containing protein n=1 Tax=Ruegeria arenilitoris TaxID=1173585 RepID=UPI00147D9E73